uniref:Putative secreted protein n=1 Tax=Xenopsylla cheopis TaxID=163159 RepID=A0A6M2E1X2_XENCH
MYNCTTKMSTGTAFNFTLIKRSLTIFIILFRTRVVHSEILRHNFTLSLPLYFTQPHDVNPAIVQFFLQILQLDYGL